MKERETLSGRVIDVPYDILEQLILQPQFGYGLENLLPFYILIERVSVDDVCELGVISPSEAASIKITLNQIDVDEINRCPLDSGVMAGLHLSWNRQCIAERLGFDAPVRSALCANIKPFLHGS